MKKYLSILLALVLTLGCVTPAFAADGDGDGETRDTEFFTEQPHTDLNYSDIKYEYIDPAPLLKEADALREFAKDGTKAAEFEKRFLAFKDNVFKVYAMYVLVDNMTYHDAKDEWAAAELEKLSENIDLVDDAFSGLVRDVLKLDNACSKVLSSKLSEEDIQDYLDYEDKTEEEIALSKRDTALESAYRAAIIDLDDRTVTIGDEEYNADDLYQAYCVDGSISLEDYLNGNHEIYSELADIYLEMIDVRNRIAVLNGYDNYAEYAYAEIYDRDYTVQDIDAFRTAVKQYLAPELMNHTSYLPSIDDAELPFDAEAYTGMKAMETLSQYFGKLSDELQESMQYVIEHKSYDIDPAPNKTGTAFSRTVPYYNMPYFFSNASGGWSDLTTTIHEMGHNNEAYWAGQDWNDDEKNHDIAEVHSQGLELLMLKFYPELFGSQANAIAQSTTINILYSVVQGCMHDELQCYAYSTPGVTAEMLNRKYRQIAEDYSLIGPEDTRPEMYGWYGIPHTFTSPMYYISYATSAAAAFAFWEESQEDYFAAVDHYLEFVALPGSIEFEDSFEEIGMESPLSPEYIQKLAKTAHDKLMFLDPYTDVYTDFWYCLPVYFVTIYGLMDGTSADTFSPDATMNRGQILTTIARFADDREDAEEPYTLEEGVDWTVENGISDGKGLSKAMTREELAVMLYRLAELFELEPAAESGLSAFSDSASVSDWAQAGLAWAVESGVINGMGDGTLNPQGSVTRAEVATVLLRFFQIIMQ